MQRQYILIEFYYDTDVTYFNSLEDLSLKLEQLKKEYENDSYFRYEVFYGIKIEE